MISRRAMMNDEIVSKSGELLQLEKCKGSYLNGLNVFGKSTQDGTPSVENPVPILNAGESGSITVEVTGRNLLKPSIVPEVQGIYAGWKIKDDDEIVTISVFDKNPNMAAPSDLAFGLTGSGVDASQSAMWLVFNGELKKKSDVSRLKYFSIYPKDVVSSVWDKYDIQIEYGTTPTPYEPYTHQSLTLATTNGLPGVPVDKNGNYTDQNGQQWICDEIDLERGKYVQRVKDFIITQDTQISTSMGTYGAPEKDTILARYLDRTIKKNGAILCRELIRIPNWNVDSESVHTTETSIDFRVSRKRLGLGTETTADENKTAVLKFLETTPLHCLVELATPIERDLTPEELAAYKSLHTYSPNTIIANSSNCGMKVSYRKIR